MRCCVPFCESTQEDISKSDGIRFLEMSIHFRFPGKGVLRSAWSLSLGLQGRVPAGAVVCSLHFLREDLLFDVNQGHFVHDGAVPTTVQVCMICLETDGKMFSLNKYNLEKSYEHLTGHTLCDEGNLKHILCVECAHRLKSFSEFREKSLRAYEIFRELYEKYDVINIWHIAQLEDVRAQLKSSLGRTMQGTDPCNLHIQEESLQFFTEVEVKIERTGSDPFNRISYSSSGPDNCPELGYTASDNEGAAEEKLLFSDNIIKDDGPIVDNEGNADIFQISDDSNHAPENNFIKARNRDLNKTTRDKIRKNNTSVIKEIWPDSQQKASPRSFRLERRENLNFVSLTSPSVNPETTSDDIVSQQSLNTRESQKGNDLDESKKFICDLCNRAFKLKCLVAKHMPVHFKPEFKCCEYCDFKSKHTSNLNKHVMIHTGEKPFQCTVCEYRCARKGNLERHMIMHTGAKPFACTYCDYKSGVQGNLLTHIRTHTGEKPYKCKLCTYECAQGSTLMHHMKHHTVEKKPYSCQLCTYKCSRKHNLRKHIMCHIGLKPLKK
ncbi:zinc finger protein 181 isoform X2 [Bicyclus anynana]|uniref:Zinc finger protein 181 isoform X2 n=1 Tax=Bicyclus anynana TaxID=110368 RepID=A0A6J1P3K9_BICAN|nr:zinc finger protein 181 isoform X2 [Bicyclus anynana]